MLADAVRGTDHLVERTSDEAGNVLRSKKGDFVLTLDPATTRGGAVRIVVEAKDRAVSGRAMRDEMVEAKRNRDGADQSLSQLVRETYKWLIAPIEEFVKGKPTLNWEVVSVSPTAPNLIQAIEEKLREEEWLIYEWSLWVPKIGVD